MIKIGSPCPSGTKCLAGVGEAYFISKGNCAISDTSPCFCNCMRSVGFRIFYFWIQMNLFAKSASPETYSSIHSFVHSFIHSYFSKAFIVFYTLFYTYFPYKNFLFFLLGDRIILI